MERQIMRNTVYVHLMGRWLLQREWKYYPIYPTSLPRRRLSRGNGSIICKAEIRLSLSPLLIPWLFTIVRALLPLSLSRKCKCESPKGEREREKIIRREKETDVSRGRERRKPLAVGERYLDTIFSPFMLMYRTEKVDSLSKQDFQLSPSAYIRSKVLH